MKRSFIFIIIFVFVVLPFSFFSFFVKKRVVVDSDIKGVKFEIVDKLLLESFLKRIDYWEGPVRLGFIGKKGGVPRGLEVRLSKNRGKYLKVKDKNGEIIQSVNYNFNRVLAVNKVEVFFTDEVISEFFMLGDKSRLTQEILVSICYQSLYAGVDNERERCAKVVEELVGRKEIFRARKVVSWNFLKPIYAASCINNYDCGDYVVTGCECSEPGFSCSYNGQSCGVDGTCQNCVTDCDATYIRDCSWKNQGTCYSQSGACGAGECATNYDCFWYDPQPGDPTPTGLPLPTTVPTSSPCECCGSMDQFIRCGTLTGVNCGGNTCIEGQSCHYVRDDRANCQPDCVYGSCNSYNYYSCVPDPNCVSGYLVGNVYNANGSNLKPTSFPYDYNCSLSVGISDTLNVYPDPVQSDPGGSPSWVCKSSFADDKYWFWPGNAGANNTGGIVSGGRTGNKNYMITMGSVPGTQGACFQQAASYNAYFTDSSLLAGQTFTISGWVKTSGSVSGYYKVNKRNSSGVWDTYWVSGRTSTVSNSNWTQVSKTFTLPSDTTQISIDGCIIGTTAGAIAYFDDLTLTDSVNGNKMLAGSFEGDFEYNTRLYPNQIYQYHQADVRITPPPGVDTSTIRWKTNNRNLVENYNFGIGTSDYTTYRQYCDPNNCDENATPPGWGTPNSGPVALCGTTLPDNTSGIAGCADAQDQCSPNPGGKYRWHTYNTHVRLLGGRKYKYSVDLKSETLNCFSMSAGYCNRGCNHYGFTSSNCFVCGCDSCPSGLYNEDSTNHVRQWGGVSTVTLGGVADGWTVDIPSDVGWTNMSHTFTASEDGSATIFFASLKLVRTLFTNIKIEEVDVNGTPYPLNKWQVGTGASGVPVFPGSSVSTAKRVDFKFGCSSCSPQCRQNDPCGGTCGVGDTGAPGVPVNLSPCGINSTTPYLLSSTTANLVWGTEPDHGLTDYYDYQVVNLDAGNTLYNTNIGNTGVGVTVTANDVYLWRTKAVNNTCSSIGVTTTYTGSWTGNCYMCRETQTCNALYCGQRSGCGVNCGVGDTGVPEVPLVIYPLGSLASPVIINDTTAVDLHWSMVGNTLTDGYGYRVVGTGVTVAGRGTTEVSYVGTYGVGYSWDARSINSSCQGIGVTTTYYSAWADPNGYFRFNRSPVFIPSSLTFRLANSIGQTVPPETGARNQICDKCFTTGGCLAGGAHNRIVKFIVIANDADGDENINKVFFRLNIGHSVSVVNMPTSPVSAVTGSGWNIDSSGVSLSALGSGTSRAVTFPMVFDGTLNNSSLYNMEVKVEDIYGGTTPWVDTTRDFKIWDCLVDVGGVLYDGSSGIACPTTGYSVLADPDMNFTGLNFNCSVPVDSKSMTVSQPAIYFSSGNPLIWSYSYLPVFNSGFEGGTPTVRVTGVGINCPLAAITLNQATVDAYSVNPSLVIDFSSIRNQDPWYQITAGGVMSRDRINNNVPITCYLDPACKSATTVENASIGVSNNSLVGAPIINNNSGCGSNCKNGIPNDWHKDANTLGDNYTYDHLYNEYFGKLGLGVTFSGNTSMSSVVIGTGGTGVAFVNGNLNVGSTNNVPIGKFFMVVVNGDIEINQSVTRLEGVFVADGGMMIGDENDAQLVVNGSLSLGGVASFTRGYATHSINNTAPAIVVNFRPDLIFNIPGVLTKTLSGWKEN